MPLSRRRFLETFPVATAATLPAARSMLAMTQQPDRQRGPNDQLQVALIGAGLRGQVDAACALQAGNAKIVAVADCYDGRLARSKELWGRDVMTTRDYREILARLDVDAVIIATPDHWHKTAAIDAMHAGKDVYLEKPMIHLYSDGPEIIAAMQQTGRILQIGSQRVSNALYVKAKQLLASGAIGQLNMVAARWDRSSAIGAWDYSVPTDASTETCDWPRFLGSAPKIPWNPERFFQWRKWTDYGSGVAGDLFVHLFSGTHFITGAHGPTKAYATGGLRYWKDGRNVPDVMLALFDYPENFNLSLRVNFIAGGEDAESFLFTGSEGTMEIANNGLTLHRAPMPKAPGYTVSTFALAEQQKYIAQYDAKYPPNPPGTLSDDTVERFNNPRGYDDTVEHFRSFYTAIRTRTPPAEDAVFGFRAAGAALLSNLSMQRGEPVHWNPETMTLGKA